MSKIVFTDENKAQQYVGRIMRGLAKAIDGELPKGWGFILLTFPFSETEKRVNYVSNTVREDTIKALRSYLQKYESGEI